jgi:Big-like domain-containing protein
VQTAFIQSGGTLGQTLTLSADTYTLSFKAAQRACCVTPYGQPLQITLDGTQVGGLITPVSTSFASFSITLAIASSGTHTIAFAGTDSSDKTTFIDTVTLTSGAVGASTTTLATSNNPMRLGRNVTYTATVTGANPTGAVAFTANGSTIAGCSSVALSGSGNSKKAACTTTFGVTGTYGIVARYGGDASNAAAASAPPSQIVKKR